VARHADPADGRRVLLSLTEAGQRILQDKRNARNEQLAKVLEAMFTPEEIRQLAAATPLLERLAQSI
jgi:DNA-binding MarR family transcriptional regulator